MLSKQITKIIQNLEKKKFREKYNLFKIEGEKLVAELLRSPLAVHAIIAYPEWIQANGHLLGKNQVLETDEKGMKAISNFQSLPHVMALAEIPNHPYHPDEVAGTLSLVLNGIQDPGNLGTILRIADWFGVSHLLCDRDCASIYNPKCVQASMGAIFRVHAYYLNLPAAISQLKAAGMPVFGTFLDGENIYTSPLPSQGLIIMGNEGKGIAEDIGKLADFRLTIPNFTPAGASSESLNVGVATGIILSEFKRRIYKL